MIASIMGILTGITYIWPDYTISMPWRIGVSVVTVALYNLFWAVKYKII